MPIVVTPSSDEPLTQGDILKGVSLFSVKSDWASSATEPCPSAGCLVLSRPCAIEHKSSIIVAAIDKQKYEPSKCTAFEDVLSFLEAQRGGYIAPDRFYLGQIPALGDGKFRANLELIHTVKLPPKSARAEAITKFRVGRLAPDFRRDLHLRFFNAIAALGFDDYTWFTTKDLEWLVRAGETELSEKQRAFMELEAGGGFTNANAKQKQEEALEQFAAELAPYQHELAKRKQEADR